MLGSTEKTKQMNKRTTTPANDRRYSGLFIPTSTMIKVARPNTIIPNTTLKIISRTYIRDSISANVCKEEMWTIL